MQRAYSTITVKALDQQARIIEGIASTPTTDRQGDIVEPKGAQFSLPIPLLWMHDTTLPVGHVTQASVTAAGIRIKAKILRTDTPGALKDRLDLAWESVQIGLVRGLSIGFKSLEYAWLDDDSYSRRFIKWLWLELSAVTIPANAEANITAIKAFDLAARADAGTARRALANLPAAVGARAKDRPMNYSEKLAAALAELKTKTARLEVLEEQAGADGSLEANEVTERDQLTTDLNTLSGQVERLKALERSMAQQASQLIVRASDEDVRRISGNGSSHSLPRIQVEEKKLPPGIELARYIICRGSALLTGNSPLEIAKARFADSPRVAMLIKEAVAGASTQDATNASPLVYATNLVAEFIEYLRPKTIIGNVDGMTRVPFNVSITGQTSGGAGYWVGEGRAKPLTSFNFNRVNLTWAKVAAISVILDELVRFSSPSAEGLIRDALTRALQERLDIDFIDPDKAAVANVSPASITNGVTPLVSHGSDLDAVDADVQAMFNQFIAAKIMPTHWIMTQTTALSVSMMRNSMGNRAYPEINMNGGTFYGLPVVASQYCAFGTPSRNIVVLLSAPEIFFADDGGFNVDISREASLEMDDAPTMSAGALGSPASPVGTSVVSMFQTNSMAVRAERFINWQRRRDAGVSYTDDVNWAPGGASV